MTPPTTMRAAVYHGPRDIRIERVPRPVPAADQVLVRVLRSGLCGTDVTEWVSGPVMIPLAQRHPHSGHGGPLVPGHEITGEVVEAPSGSPLAPGALVVSGAQVVCGDCARCREGRVNICERLFTLGLNAPGGHAEYVVGPSRSFVPVPAGLSLDAAGLAQPLAVGLHAARRCGAAPGDRVMISGAGAIGGFVLAGLRHLVPDLHVTVVDVDAARLARVRELGADAVELAGERDGERFDVTVEASGAAAALASCVARTRTGGRVMAVGMPAGSTAVPLHDLVLREIALLTSVALVTDEDVAPALEILATTDLAQRVLESVRPLGDIAGTLEEMARGSVRGKVLLDPAR